MRFSWSTRNLLISGLVATLLTVSGAWGQTGTTSVRGTVTDKTGAAIVGAKVSLANQGSGLQRETSSGPSGEFEFLALPPGTYALTVEKQGFRKFEAGNLQLLVNSPTTESVALQVGSTTETVRS